MVKNFGLLLADPKPTDYMFGGATEVAGTTLQPNGQWVDFLPEGEKQHSVYFDTMACTIFSAMNVLEILIKRQYGIDVNFSDRFTAKMSGTTHQGNYLFKVGDSIRKDGFVEEVEYPYPREQRTPVFTWENFYQEIAQILKDIGLLNLKGALIQYEQVGKEGFIQALKEAPIQVTVRAWYDTNGDLIYENSDPTKVNHAVVLIGYKLNEYWLIFDSYDKNGSYIKKLEWSYAFGATGFKYNITKLNNDMRLQLVQKIGKDDVYIMAPITTGGYELYKITNSSFLNAAQKIGWTVDWSKIWQVHDFNEIQGGHTVMDIEFAAIKE